LASLSLDECRAIRFGAASVYERVGAFVARQAAIADTDVPILPEANAQLQNWSRVFSPGDRDAFLRRLQWDGLDWTTVAKALSATSIDPEPDADWTTWLDLILEAAGPLGRECEEGAPPETAWFEPGEEPPFIEIAAAGARAARGFLLQLNPDAYASFSESAQRAIERQLLKELALFSERTLYELFQRMLAAPPEGEGSPPAADEDRPKDARYRGFVVSMLDEGLSTFWVAYPVLARVTAQVIEKWVESTNDLSRRLEADRHAITLQFGDGVDPGYVTALEPALSDPHNGRRRVAALTFDSGLRLIYKPRDVGIEKAFAGFLEWISTHTSLPRQRALRVIERPGYGWVEFARHESFDDESEVRRYYEQAGGMAALAHLLGAMDLHMENVAATRRGPVIVDPESLLYPGRPRVTESNPRSHDRKSPSCVETGFITFGETGPDGLRYETGGLRGTGLRGSARARRQWTGLRADALGFTEQHEFQAPSANRVVLRGMEQRPEAYRTELLDGFAATYRFCADMRDRLVDPNGPLSAFEGRRARVLFRPTNQYAVLQDVLAAPKYQASGIARSTALDVMARPFTMDRARPLAWPVAVEERRALENLDVPHFTVATGETAVHAGDRPVGDRFFSRSGLEMARDRMRGLSEADLAIQLEWIERSLSESATSRFHVAAPTAAPHGTSEAAAAARHIAVASWIGREFLDRASADADALTWRLHAPGQTVGEVDRHAIYSGSLGPALFLAALARVTDEGSWAAAARQAAVPVCRFVEDLRGGVSLAGNPLGIGSGVGSIVYGLRWLGTLLDDTAFVDLATRVAAAIEPSAIEGDRDLDIIGGSAGAILSLLSLQAAIGDRVLDRAIMCGDRLVATQVHTHWGSNWPSRDSRMLAGFAHGAAGIAYALVRLYEATGKRTYLDAALRAHRYERSVYSAAHRNWPLVRSAGHLPGNVAIVMTAWCHGAPGIGLARALVRDAVIREDPEVDQEIEIALTTTAALAGNPGDHLCCGNIGRCDVLFTAGRLLGRQSAIDAAASLAARIEDQALARGYFQFVSPGSEYVVFEPGFFQGLSGIGYQLLRLAAPARLPSMLAFEGRVPAAVAAEVRT
jgi:type 2 lantibiotic biosynthesis protein LanM